jgi:diphthamide synthase (EF-2-diphthine--ammonia ligase)
VAAAAGPLPPQTRRFFIGLQTIQSRHRRSRTEGLSAGPAEEPPHLSFAPSWSGGKDSALVLWTLRREALRRAEAFAAEPLSRVDRVAFGDLFLEDVRAYREERLAAGGKCGLFPLCGRDTMALAQQFLAAGFEATLVCVDPRLLDPSFAGRRYDERLLAELPPGVDPCGENGEFHTFVHAGPIFGEPIACEPGEIVERDGFAFCDLMPA